MLDTIQLPSVLALKERLQSDPVFRRYRKAGEKVHQNQELLTLYGRYTTLQKEVVNLSHYKLAEATRQKEEELKAIEEALFDNPLFAEYMQLQVELEELLQTMAFLVESKVNSFLDEC
ncbi:MAG: YlbF family regulator [Turicibacter sp.]|nr:YlbF family regulator [Turicibacter sp.]